MVGNEDAKKRNKAWSPLYHHSWCQSRDCRGKVVSFYSCLCLAAKRGPGQTQDQRSSMCYSKEAPRWGCSRANVNHSVRHMSEQKVALRPRGGLSQELIWHLVAIRDVCAGGWRGGDTWRDLHCELASERGRISGRWAAEGSVWGPSRVSQGTEA